MEPSYPIIRVPDDAPEDLESVGSKEKFWYTKEEKGPRWLFKANRLIREDPEIWAGEDWSEKVAAELCTLLNLPHAVYELATWTNKRGVISRQIERHLERATVGSEQDDGFIERLVLGNELLAGHVQGYPHVQDDNFYRIPQYTLELTLDMLANTEIDIIDDPEWTPPAGISTPSETFVGYLLLDAWIGNTDRHDKNWGILEQSTEHGVQRYLAPTFDHASCLGRELTDEERHERLTTRDRGRKVEAYVNKARSAFFLREGDDQTMHPIKAFQEAARRYGNAADVWLAALTEVDEDDVASILRRLPQSRIAPVGIEFASNVLHLNKQVLLGT